MTSELAALVGARQAGRGRWSARCPAHDDKNASLTITEGRRGVLLKCWSRQCSTSAIVSALGLRMCDLFYGPPLTPEKAAQAALVNAAREELNRQRRTIDIQRIVRVRELENLVDALGAKLVREPDHARLGRLFHVTLDKLREAETALGYSPPEAGSKRMEAPPESIAPVHGALVEIGTMFDAQTKRPAVNGSNREG